MSSQNDFSFFSLFTAGLALFAPLASAWTQPVGSSPSGNPIYTPGLNEIVPAGKPYTITWNPTTEGTIDLVLLKGPSTNAVPQYAIASAIPNSGNFTWTPATDLVPTGNSGYGIELIVTSNGQYQYSTQFGISNKSPAPYSASSSSSSSKPLPPTSYAHSATTSSSPTTTIISEGTSSADVTTTVSTSAYPTIIATPSISSYTAINTTVVAPTGGMQTSYGSPTGNSTGTSTGYTGPAATGGAVSVATSLVGIVLAAGAAVLMV